MKLILRFSLLMIILSVSCFVVLLIYMLSLSWFFSRDSLLNVGKYSIDYAVVVLATYYSVYFTLKKCKIFKF